MSTRHRGHRRRCANLKCYLLISLACILAALALHYLYSAPDQIERYAGEKLDEAVRKAVKTEIQEAAGKRP